MLKIADRCDYCGAQAFVRVARLAPGGGVHDLLFCGHHYAEHESVIAAGAWIITDERSRINAKPSVSTGTE